jgi:hypothetical protein
MGWGDWLLVSFLGALGAGLLVALVTFGVDAYFGDVRSVTLANGPVWRVRNGRRVAYVKSVGLRVYRSGERPVSVCLAGQRPWAKDATGGQRQGDTVMMEPGSVMDFGPTEGIIAALNRQQVDVAGEMVVVRPFVRVLGRKHSRYGWRRCRLNWATGQVTH